MAKHLWLHRNKLQHGHHLFLLYTILSSIFLYYSILQIISETSTEHFFYMHTKSLQVFPPLLNIFSLPTLLFSLKSFIFILLLNNKTNKKIDLWSESEVPSNGLHSLSYMGSKYKCLSHWTIIKALLSLLSWANPQHVLIHIILFINRRSYKPHNSVYLSRDPL